MNPYITPTFYLLKGAIGFGAQAAGAFIGLGVIKRHNNGGLDGYNKGLIMEKKLETTVQGLGLYWGYIGIMERNEIYYSIMRGITQWCYRDQLILPLLGPTNRMQEKS